ncbi:MAG: lecithin retinol acyltransferase family protein [Polaromonas sp.]
MAHQIHTRRLAADEEPPIAAQVVTQRCGYTHHGIYVGDGWVVHYAGWSRALQCGPVQQVSLAQFAGGREVWIERSANPKYPAEEVVQRALSRLGEDHYALATNNCEHFCTWCLRGEGRSEQVERWLRWPRRMLNAALGAVPPLFGAPATT